tara:strand:+ start:487 stop:915 length:429 start_codon:yes stop_codon:yes gene_type:complete
MDPRLVVVSLLLLAATPSCQEPNPARTVVSLQLDWDGEQAWVYIYTTPRVRMDNLTIAFGNDTLREPGVYTLQRATDAVEFSLTVEAELSGVLWGFSGNITLEDQGLEEPEYHALVEIPVEDTEPREEDWGLPRSRPLERLP